MEMNEHAAAWDRISIVTSTLNQMVQQILPGDNDINVDGAYQGLSPQDTIKAMLRELADDKLVVMISLGELTRAAIRLETMRLGLCELFVIRRDALRECHMRECRYS
jgi:hypothetical protein